MNRKEYKRTGVVLVIVAVLQYIAAYADKYGADASRLAAVSYTHLRAHET